MSEWTHETWLERLRLALTDPAGEAEALAMVSQHRATSGIARLTGPRSHPPGHPDDDLATALGIDVSRGQGRIRCPAHLGRSASLSWRVDGGRLLLHCFGGCTFGDILATVGR
jgi:hypothetical protein